HGRRRVEPGQRPAHGKQCQCRPEAESLFGSDDSLVARLSNRTTQPDFAVDAKPDWLQHFAKFLKGIAATHVPTVLLRVKARMLIVGMRGVGTAQVQRAAGPKNLPERAANPGVIGNVLKHFGADDRVKRSAEFFDVIQIMRNKLHALLAN